MSIIDDLRKKAADLVSDEVPEVKSAPVLGVGLRPGPVFSMDPRPAEIAPTPNSANTSSSTYKTLRQNTDESQCTALAKVLAFAAPLVEVLPDESTRLKAAFAQAKAQGLTVADVQHDLTALAKVLNDEHDRFTSAMGAKRAELIDGRSQQIASLEAQLRELRASVEGDRQRLDARAADFTMAEAQRRKEIEELTYRFNAILK